MFYQHLFSWPKYIYSFRDKKDPTIWVFGEWLGKKCCDNCAYFANHVVSRTNSIKVYWICDKSTNTNMLSDKIFVIERDSKAAKNILKHAGAIFFNQNFTDISPNPYNCYGKSLSLNFWHGVPWKKIGFDAFKKKDVLFYLFCRLQNRLLKAKYYVSISDIYADKIKSAFGATEKELIEAGFPRNAPFYSKIEQNKSREIILTKIKANQTHNNLEEITIIAYMPTFRDNESTVIDLKQNLDDDFMQWLKENNVFIVQKAHFVDSERRNFIEQKKQNLIISNDINATVLMSAADILISDYSSCIFDYLLLDRPIIHFVYDYEQYKNNDRGLYFDIDDIKCGLVVRTISELQKAIKISLKEPNEMSILRQIRRNELMTHDSVNSCEKIYSWVCKKLKIDFQCENKAKAPNEFTAQI